jgi:hypothetical protein
VRERESEKEGRMTWTYVGAGIMTWRCLKEKNNFLSASAFNLYKLTGEIPMQLADGLIFLSVLNLSYNQLVGQIPFIKQFATFSEASYEGNKGLYGCPLKKGCTSTKPRSPPPTFEDSHSKFGLLIDWNYLSAKLRFVFGFWLIIGPLMFWKRWRIQYYKHVDDIFFKIFPQLYLLGGKYRRIRANRNGVQRH